MLRHKLIDRVCCVILVLTLLVGTLYVGAAAQGWITEDTTIGYETRLFDQSRVHTIDIVMDDWEGFLKTATSEVYSACHLVIDGESYKNVGIRGKGNTSLSSVQAYGNNRYSFKVEFDQYQSGMTYHGLDKLSLNNLIQDNPYMKDYFAYTLMNKMGVAAPLCSFVRINVNGEYWGLYLAVEGVEDSFLQRNYGKRHGELYKPDALSMGGGRGNGEDFDMNAAAEEFGFSFDDAGGEGNQAQPGGDGSFGGSAGGSSGDSAGGPAATPTPTATATPEPTATPAPTAAPAADDSFGGSAGDAASNGNAAPAGDAASNGNAAPAGDAASNGNAAPAGNAGPDGDAVSNGNAASSGMPAGGETPAMPSGAPADGAMPDASSIPQMPADGTIPQGFDPNQVMGSSGDAASATTSAATDTPAATDMPAAPEGFDFAQMGTMPADGGRPEMPEGFEMPDMGGGFGGFGSSSDVKLQYSNDNPSSYSNIFNNAKTDITESDKTRLIASLKALNEGDTSVVDTDAVIRYMAVHNFLCNDDSYTGMMVHNYYLYEENGVLSMIPWDYNLAYGGFSGGSNGTSTVNTTISRLVSMGSDRDRPMAGWITSNEAYKAQYLAVYQEFITTVFDSGWFIEEIDRVIAMIDPYVQEDPTAFCTYEEFQTASQIIKSFCLKRAQSVTNQLNGSNTTVDASELNLSAMGTMNNGGGFEMPGGPGEGGFERPDRGGEQTNAPAGDNGQFPQGGDGFGSSGGQAAPQASEVPEATDAPESTDAPSEKERTRPSFDGGFNMGNMTHQNTNEAWMWVAVSVAMLAAALILVKVYRNNR